jgi:hypothetical protein
MLEMIPFVLSQGFVGLQVLITSAAKRSKFVLNGGKHNATVPVGEVHTVEHISTLSTVRLKVLIWTKASLCWNTE